MSGVILFLLGVSCTVLVLIVTGWIDIVAVNKQTKELCTDCQKRRERKAQEARTEYERKITQVLASLSIDDMVYLRSLRHATFLPDAGVDAFGMRLSGAMMNDLIARVRKGA